jgi:hypothetical protein
LAENALQQVNRFGSQFAAVIEEPIIARALSTLLPVVSILLDDSKSKPHPFLLAVSEGPSALTPRVIATRTAAPANGPTTSDEPTPPNAGSVLGTV